MIAQRLLRAILRAGALAKPPHDGKRRNRAGGPPVLVRFGLVGFK